MAKTILLPIDLRVPSLVTLKHAMEQHAAGEVAVHLLYAEELSGSITEMLFYSPRNILKEKSGTPFAEALEIIRNRYSDCITKVSFEFLHFNSLSYLRRLLTTLGITDIYLPASYALHQSGRAFDPVPLLKKAGIPAHTIPFDASHNKSEQEHILSLFN